MAKIQLIRKLIDDGFFDTVREAEAYLMAGQILVDGMKVTKNVKVAGDCTVTVVSPPYSGKGGLKLEHALKALDVSVEDKVCIDAGASTGGFTDCLLKKGARLVYAVDGWVGVGQKEHLHCPFARVAPVRRIPNRVALRTRGLGFRLCCGRRAWFPDVAARYVF